ncbi:hypothetical protein QBC42DRAFT_290881 [Cladorrhinum samala]|uniref:Cyanovirin-N domain-containing protein n=1 Tax=Cladorrhinum samala TaxID=585594 RepID=A0AAV9HBI3_9PEZI|nr:hypothetical protein QBC42DRAFT_290881 [Cladorrhinum samala]
MKLSLGFTLGLAGLAQLAAADNGFKDSCNSDWYVEGGHYMIANCRRPDGSLVRTRMDLNLCMGRNTANGSLLGKQGGNAWNACTDLRKAGAASIGGSCLNGLGYWVYSTVDINQFIGNTNGYLSCYRQRAPTY